MGEGLAVGCLVEGVTGLDPAEADEALRRALQTWPWVTRYPTVRRTPAVVGTMRSSPGRRGLKVAQWVFSRGLAVPQLRDDAWDLPAACARLEGETGVPARRWLDLARTFLAELPESTVWRAPALAADPDALPDA
ncbi:hypothetical protein GCM10023201_20730 [Actinomycetospora corticicola]|uniref:Uncharacterized protein n=1 Tax=Actinomycetospora corticicola TaxID=663602 RepID=A0A7Y9DRL2_9PSEU|nr:hypothetical protein [Actinomycetospora corticicola]NYD34211.1 hypothetical protein [Actinomycetospora corticicola]